MNSFLPGKYHKFFITALVFMLLVGSWFMFILLMLAYAIALFFFRRSKLLSLKESDLSQGVLYSPVNGKVLAITKDVSHPLFGENLTVVRLSVPWWNESGIYLPSSAEVKEVSQSKLQDKFRYLKQLENSKDFTDLGLCMSFENKAGDLYGLQLIKCPTGMYPEVGVIPGDRGKARANIGYFPFGGSVLLYIPENYKIMISDKESVVAGVTLIGGE